jgi:hypothetical protein
MTRTRAECAKAILIDLECQMRHIAKGLDEGAVLVGWPKNTGPKIDVRELLEGLGLDYA